MKSKRMGSRVLLGVVIASALMARSPQAQQEGAASSLAAPTPYHWDNVRIVAGGFVDGILFHPTEHDVAYLRTDMGGAYRWIATQKRWKPITDGFGQKDWNLHGIESLALDPHDANQVYIAAGTYTNSWAGNGAMLRSSDRGESWQRTDVPFKMGGNEDGRSAGERLAVDPMLGSVLYFGSRHNGLWRSTDRGVTWREATSFPVKGRTNGTGIVWVVFNPEGSAAGSPTKTVYVGVQQVGGPGVFVSHDAGATWTSLAGQPNGLYPHQAQLDRQGNLFITYADAPGPNGMKSGAVWRYATKTGEWKDISPLPPNSGGIAGISLDRSHPGTLVVSTMDRWGPGDDVFRTTDAGATWVGFKDHAVLDAGASPFLKWGGDKPKFGWWIGAVAIDPFNSGHILFATGATIWETRDGQALNTGATHWSVGGLGVEQTAVTDLISPPTGAHLVSALGDIAGFRHDDFSHSPSIGLANTPITGTSVSLDFAQKQPELMVRTGHGKPGVLGAISHDGGASWAAFASQPTAARGPGHIAISADGGSIVWAPEGSGPIVSTDFGSRWTACVGLPGGLRPVSDRVNPKVFYAYDGATCTILVSEDGGGHFISRSGGLPKGNSDVRIRCDTKRQGYLWVVINGKLHYSQDGGNNMLQVGSVDHADAVGLGCPQGGQSQPVLYLIGIVNGVEGIFRSGDNGATWTRINDERHQFGPIGPIIGDPRVFGRVYVGSNGRGILVGNAAGR